MTRQYSSLRPLARLLALVATALCLLVTGCGSPEEKTEGAALTPAPLQVGQVSQALTCGVTVCPNAFCYTCLAGACVVDGTKNGTACNDGNICTSTDVCDPAGSGTCVGAIPTACQNGLTGNFFNWGGGGNSTTATAALAGTSVLTRVDSTIFYDWGNGSPGAPVGVDNFSVRWTGQVVATVTGSYSFRTTADDGIRLWVNGVLLIDNWVDQAPTQQTGSISLVAGTRYTIKIEYYENGGGAVAKLEWQPPASGSYVTVPSANLIASTGTCSACPTGSECTAESCGVNTCSTAALVPDGTACTGGSCVSGGCCTGCMNGGSCLAVASQTFTQCGVAGAACGSCDDGNPCTIDSCSGAGGCTHVAGNAGTVCRAAAGVCDVAETCTGSSTTCPADVLAASGAACADEPNVCTVDACNGVSAACQHTIPGGCQNGLTGNFFNWGGGGNATTATAALAGTSNLTRVDSTVFYDWGNGSPGAPIGVDNFSVRWTGQVLASTTGSYSFRTTADDGIRLWVNSVLLIDNWVDQAPTQRTGSISLVAGVRYDVKIEYYENGGGAVAKFEWQTPASGSYVTVPSSNLFPGSGTCSVCPTGNPCTVETCAVSSCSTPANVADGTACPSGVCQSGVCCSGCMNGGSCVALGSETVTQCGAAGSACASCDDGNPCTVDSCTGAGGCTHTAGNSGTVCRAAIGACDVAETCTGASTTCPADVLAASGTACADEPNVCTVDTCNGSSTACQHNIPGGCQNGLTGNYFNWGGGGNSTTATTALSGTSNLTRVDSTVYFDWGNGSPGAPIGADNFSVRWTGQVLASATGVYSFRTTSDDGIRLWVNSVLLVDDWQDQGPSPRTGTISLVSGVRYDVKIEYYENGGGAVAEFEWQPPAAGSYVTVPNSNLFPGAGNCSVCPTGNPCTMETCGGSACSAPANVADGTSCPGGVCQAGACCSGCMNGGACVALASETATKCGSGAAACASCDDGNACTVDACTAAGACTHTPGNAGAVCRAAAAGSCDVSETCDGVSSVCPADGFAAAGAVCRPVAAECDVAESCPGGSPTCPTDLFKGFLTACADDGDVCTNDYCSGIAAACSHPASTLCAGGLTATYYDNQDFSGPTFTRVDPTVNFDWGNGSPDSSIGVDTFSARWTGQVLADFSGTYTFETESDDGVRLWVNDVMLVDDMHDQGPTKYSGTITLVAGTRNDIKVDYYEAGGGASVKLRWSSASVAYGIIPQDHLFPGGDKGTGGMTYVDGANNGTGDPYVVWRLSSTPGVSPVNASAETANNWGLGNAVMMVPAFSPDGKKLVFIDGDGGGGSGWRKGLSMFNFDETAKLFSNRQSLRNTWALGDVMKWPVWESDSRSVIFQTSTPTELCSCSTTYGNMAPTNYYGTPGTLWSIDSTGASPAIQLTNLNTGERAADANKSYQPTVLPIAVGGYRWTVFTSTRPYGNTLNPPGIDRSCTASQLWVSAIDDNTSAASDRSHPAFWLPNQNIGAPTQNSFVNERGYWVKGPCKPNTTIGPESACITNDDCCGAPTTAACRIDQPATVPPTRHCIAINPNVCVSNGGSCGGDNDCCGFPATHCIAGVCLPNAPVPAYGPGDFTRDYFGNCPQDTSPVWRFFDWQSITPGDSSIVFTAQTAATSAGLAAAPSVPVGTAAGPPTTGWIGEDVGNALELNNQVSQLYLRITMSIKPSSDKISTPTLSKWRQSFSCLPSQ